LIAPFWDDLDPSASGYIYYGVLGSAPNRVAIFEWYDISDFSQTGTASFEVKLYEQDGSIEFHYLDTVFGDAALDYGSSATIGIQDGTVSGYDLERSYNAPVAGNQSAVRFVQCWDDDGDGYLDQSCAADDCDDGDPGVRPGAAEACNQRDDDCDGEVDEEGAIGCLPYYLDDDGDGYGLSGEERCLCDAAPPYDAQQTGDCDDANHDTHPTATELCDGEDNDCDDVLGIDEVDNDNDGWMICAADCDDTDASTYPGAPELCDGMDNDCDLSLASSELDEDADGYRVCEGDCDDSSASVHPGIVEEDTCDGLDSNCDGWIAEDESDGDQDGFMVCEDDCDDTDPNTFPSDAVDGHDVCDGIDNNCDGQVDEDSLDSDGDGVSICGGDCDDLDAFTHLDASEICDGKDNDCDGVVPNNEKDVDGDGYRICEGDCSDNDEVTYPGAPEYCDGIDNDCDGELPDDEIDPDGDGVMACDGDCDETQGTGVLSNPELPEDCTDGIDNDCDGALDLEDRDCSSSQRVCACTKSQASVTTRALGSLLLPLLPIAFLAHRRRRNALSSIASSGIVATPRLLIWMFIVASIASPLRAEATEWTIMAYLSGDDSGVLYWNTIEGDVYEDLEEIGNVGSDANIEIVVQMDLYNGVWPWANWDTCKRFYISQSGPTEEDDLGECDMSSSITLYEFLHWAMSTYPADKYALILGGHGCGWQGTVSDDSPYSGSMLGDLATPLSLVTPPKIDLVFFDSCLMGMLEIAYEIAPYSDYMVASENMKRSCCVEYENILSHVKSTPTMSPQTLGTWFAWEYINEVTNIGWPLNCDDCTMSVLDLSNIEDLVDEIDDFAEASLGYMYEYDLSDIRMEAIEIQLAVDDVVYSNHTGPDAGDTSGLSLYFPETSPGVNVWTAYQGGAVNDDYFSGYAEDSLWVEYMDEFWSYLYSTEIGAARANAYEFEFCGGDPDAVDIGYYFSELTSGYPILDYAGYQIDAPAAGGVQTELCVEVHNHGDTSAMNVEGYVNSVVPDDGQVIWDAPDEDPFSWWGEIPAYATETPTGYDCFTFSLVDNCNIDEIEFEIQIIDDEVGAHWFGFNIPTYCDPESDCSDNIDNDYDSLVDCDDADCEWDPACLPPESCDNGVDDDGDGDADCDDSDCFTEPPCNPEGDCSNNVDDDLDGQTDCCDSDCDSDPICTELCDDGIDNDCDNDADCDDDECDSEPQCNPEGNCNNGIDDDADGDTDCDDADCVNDPACQTGPEDCANGIDDDGDNLTDCADPECYSHPQCMPESDCSNVIDDDQDGQTDCCDSDCLGDPYCTEVCDDNTDNDCDNDTDCSDSDCLGAPQCSPESDCSNGLDDDVDGDADCDDSDCASDPYCQGQSEVCNNGVDDDGDGDADCDDPDCTSHPDCQGQAEVCNNGVDDDGDGDTDCDDSECVSHADCLGQAEVCNNGLDDDADGDTDCDDSDCANDPGCQGQNEDCANGLDDDGDGDADCDDPDCSGDPICQGLPEDCGNGADDDLDGHTDCDDSDCQFEPQCNPEGDCTNSVDDDLDGMTDCCDGDCASDPACLEVCDDGTDNDCDADADCDDSDCSDEVYCNPETDCGDSVDDDLDGLIDCCDSDCSGAAECVELCDDGADNDCDGSTDCDDEDCGAEVHCNPEVDCGNGLDDDLDGTADCEDPDCFADDLCLDADGDGFTVLAGDCDDSNADVYPGAAELCDGLDNDCDGQALADEVDADGDGYWACADCDDLAANVHPGAAEQECDGVDNDCDGEIDEDADCTDDLVDNDGDGYVNEDDCDDSDWSVHPGAEEVDCDGIDNDCDGEVDEGSEDCGGDEPEEPTGLDEDDDGDGYCEGEDLDGDGVVECSDGSVPGDCNDANNEVHPGALEVPFDLRDNNCDGNVDEALPVGCVCEQRSAGIGHLPGSILLALFVLVARRNRILGLLRRSATPVLFICLTTLALGCTSDWQMLRAPSEPIVELLAPADNQRYVEGESVEGLAYVYDRETDLAGDSLPPLEVGWLWMEAEPDQLGAGKETTRDLVPSEPVDFDEVGTLVATEIAPDLFFVDQATSGDDQVGVGWLGVRVLKRMESDTDCR